MSKEINNLIIKDASICFKNFRGEGTPFNPAGRRGFSVIFRDPDTVAELSADGWNLKPLKKRNEEDEPAWHLPVAVKFEVRPPQIYIVTYPNGRMKKTEITEESINMLDFAEISKIDLIVTPYNWEMNGSRGIKAYLKTMYVTVVTDELADEYYTEEEE